MSTGPVELQGITINAGILETLQGFSTNRNVLKGVTIAVGTGAQIMQLKVVDRNYEPIEGATCRVLNATFKGSNVLSFDGVDDYSLIPNNNNLNGNRPFTIEAWVKFSKTTDRSIFGKGLLVSGQGGYDFRITSSSGKIRLNLVKYYVTDQWVLSSVNFETGKWFHLAAVADTTNVKYYVDGVFQGQYNNSAAYQTNMADAYIGKGRGFSLFFGGDIADVRFWNTARTEQQIADNKDTRLLGNESGLIEYWKLDEGTGILFNGLTNNGTIYGATWQEADESFPLYDYSIQGYDTTPYDTGTTNANGLTTLNYQINTIHGLEVTLPGKRRFIMPFQRTTRGLLDWQVMLSDYLATFATDRGNILINSEPENNDANFLIE